MGIVALYEPQSFITYGGVLAAPVFQAIAKDTLEYLKVPPKFEKESVKVSKNLIKVPNVRNYLVAEAIQILEKAGLNVRVSGDGAVVTDQTPKPIVPVAKGTTVILETSPQNMADYFPLGISSSLVLIGLFLLVLNIQLRPLYPM